jgi:hypothetical protein
LLSSTTSTRSDEDDSFRRSGEAPSERACRAAHPPASRASRVISPAARSLDTGPAPDSNRDWNE